MTIIFVTCQSQYRSFNTGYLSMVIFYRNCCSYCCSTDNCNNATATADNGECSGTGSVASKAWSMVATESYNFNNATATAVKGKYNGTVSVASKVWLMVATESYNFHNATETADNGDYNGTGALASKTWLMVIIALKALLVAFLSHGTAFD